MPIFFTIAGVFSGALDAVAASATCIVRGSLFMALLSPNGSVPPGKKSVVLTVYNVFCCLSGSTGIFFPEILPVKKNRRTPFQNTVAAVYRTLYEKYEQNDVLHVGIQEVVEAEKEVDTFLKSLDRSQRDQLDTLLGRLSRAYEMQGFLFGGLASGAKWNGKTAPEPGDGYGRSVRAYHGSTLAPVCQIDRKTNQVIHEYPSIAAASRATGLDDSAIGKVCKGKLPHAGGFLFRYIEQ